MRRARPIPFQSRRGALTCSKYLVMPDGEKLITAGESIYRAGYLSAAQPHPNSVAVPGIRVSAFPAGMTGVVNFQQVA
uniref:Uncharacterized protein n=1 Tax=Candidatus Kentrum sp. TUN TaxID=2126343 RepID=A0A450ZXQ6_9GAMM|nr:MAG: hypothetical protein BECKTUN1418D_GA0071000_10856 [Candidatus Kentron sp. TUN]